MRFKSIFVVTVCGLIPVGDEEIEIFTTLTTSDKWLKRRNTFSFTFAPRGKSDDKKLYFFGNEKKTFPFYTDFIPNKWPGGCWRKGVGWEGPRPKREQLSKTRKVGGHASAETFIMESRAPDETSRTVSPCMRSVPIPAGDGGGPHETASSRLMLHASDTERERFMVGEYKY